MSPSVSKNLENLACNFIMNLSQNTLKVSTRNFVILSEFLILWIFSKILQEFLQIYPDRHVTSFPGISSEFSLIFLLKFLKLFYFFINSSTDALRTICRDFLINLSKIFSKISKTFHRFPQLFFHRLLYEIFQVSFHKDLQEFFWKIFHRFF